ncbi:cobalamin B12-binding domain-containing protein [Streptomyces sp. YH02]|uniref:cobalamin B12-binding domain-containing protein n=1 Tax=Streptomyces sp. YH02 TaxID=3256999 RepID=UPI003756F5C7
MSVLASATRRKTEALEVCVTGLSSDAHTWNLVFLQLLLEDLGHRVINLGPCMPDSEIVEACRRDSPDLLVVSTVNGHGFNAAGPLIAALRARRELSELPVVIGGKLGITDSGQQQRVNDLIDAGYNAVFEEGAGLASFESFIGTLPAGGQRGIV